MGLGRPQFWLKAALVIAAIVMPFGTVILIVIAAARARRARRAEASYAEWWRLREETRSQPVRSAALLRNEDEREIAQVTHHRR